MKGYAPGQAIEITINVDNKSNRTYDHFTGSILKVNFSLDQHHRRATEAVCDDPISECVYSKQTMIPSLTKNLQKIEFYASDRTSSSTEELATFNCEGCKAGERLSRKLIVTVPPTARTEKSDICSISYQLTVNIPKCTTSTFCSVFRTTNLFFW